MFYCKECGDRVGWPTEHMFDGGSIGLCELCERERVCIDIPSRLLLPPSNKHEMQKINADLKVRREATNKQS